MKEVHHIVKEPTGKVRATSLRFLLDSLPPDGYTVTVTNDNRRSDAQNALIHMLFRMAAKWITESTGQKTTEGDVKVWLKMLHLPRDIVMPDGEVVKVCRDTHELDEAETSEFIERCYATLAEVGIVLPEPGEQLTLAQRFVTISR